jgi:protease-4
VDDVHLQFIEAVSSGRKLNVETVRQLADGRVFTGRQACTVGLVDKIGGLEDAKDEAKKRARITGEPRIVRPETNEGILGLLKKILPWSITPLPLRGDLSQGLGLARPVRLDYSIQ